jgi:hypothetical protein
MTRGEARRLSAVSARELAPTRPVSPVLDRALTAQQLGRVILVFALGIALAALVLFNVWITG